MSELSGVHLDHSTMHPENPDGTKVVERIALQHGMVIPGFAETMDFTEVQLDFPKKSITLFSTKDKLEAEAIVEKLNGFLHSSSNGAARGKNNVLSDLLL